MTTTWTTADLQAIAVFTTGTEAVPASLTAGLALEKLEGIVCFLESTTAVEETITPFDLGSLVAYALPPGGTAWCRLASADIVVPAGLKTLAGGPFTVVVPRGRICFAPSSIAVASKLTMIAARHLR